MSGEEKGIKILHVDDEPDFLALTKAILERENENFSIEGSTSAEEGIELSKGGKYDVVISDYKMPGMDGLEFLQNLRRGGNNIPFIVFTGKGREEVAMEALNKGANHYLQKGGDVKSLFGTLAHVIKEEVEKKRAEDKLAEVEKERQIILDSVPAMIFFKDRDSKFIYVNKLLAEVYGRNPADFMGKSTREIFPAEAEAQIKNDNEVVESGIPKTGIIDDFRTPEGKRWMRTDRVPLKDADGNVTGIVGFAVDVTERKRAEDKLRESEERFRAIFDTAQDSVFIKNHTLKYTLVNPAMEKLFDLPASKLIGRTDDDLFDKEAASHTREVDSRVLEGEIAEEEHTKKIKGVSFTFHIIKVPIRDESGKIVGLGGIARDATERKRAEDGIRESEEKYRSLVETTEDSVYLVDGDCRYLFMNDKYLFRFEGLPIDKVIDRAYGEFHSPEETKEFAEIVNHVFKTGKSVQSEHRSRRDGRYFLRTLSHVKDSEGRTTAVTVVSKDITERKKAEEERECLVKELEAKNAEMTRFTYTVSHDLRSPLISIQGFTEMLRKDLEQNEIEKVENDLKFIENSATKMDHLLTDTLQLSRIGRFVNPPEDVPFGEIAQEAQVQTTEQIKSSGVEITVAEDFPAVHVDRMRIAEVLVNLITNSINYMGEQPHPKIDIGYRVDEEETVFFVRDNGIGIDPSQHEKVFELFYQIEKNNKGTGAGLAIVKRIIEVHEGRIWIESEKGKGCTVCFTLPVHKNK
ncbi:MAG: PAS domain S-box protein [Halobacteriota archaeon]